MAARSRGNRTNFDWLRKSCDISTCDLSPDGNPEKYRRPMKSAIGDCVLIFTMFSFCQPHYIFRKIGHIHPLYLCKFL